MVAPMPSYSVSVTGKVGPKLLFSVLRRVDLTLAVGELAQQLVDEFSDDSVTSLHANMVHTDQIRLKLLKKKKKKKATRPTLFENFLLLQYNNFFFFGLRLIWNDSGSEQARLIASNFDAWLVCTQMLCSFWSLHYPSSLALVPRLFHPHSTYVGCRLYQPNYNNKDAYPSYSRFYFGISGCC